MTISDNLPITFWLNGVESFNQKRVPGKMQVCFCQPWQSSDEIKIQVLEETGYNLVVRVYSVLDDTLLDEVAFVEASGVYLAEFTFASLSIDNSKVYLKIEIPPPTLANLEDFTNGGSGTSWGGTAPPINSLSGVLEQSKYWHAPFNAISGRTYEFSLDIDLNNNFRGNVLTVALLDGSLNTVGTYTIHLSGYTGVVNIQETFEITATSNAQYVGIKYNVDDASSFNTCDAEINSFTYNGGNDEVIAYSDCLYIAEDDETFLIQYSNEHNFAGIDYSADTVFGIRVHASFFNERSPQDDEAEEMSDKVVEKLSSTIKDQTQLQVEPAPFYFHKKLKRILQHNTVYIDGKYWVMEENYEIQEISQRQPLQKGSVWLTERTGKSDTNIYGSITNV